MTETEIVKGIKAGNEQAFKELVELHKDKIVNACYGFLQNREDAEDMAQEVFVDAYQSIHRFRSEARLSTWLYRIAVNKSLNLVKKNKRKKWIGSLQTIFQSEQQEKDVEDVRTPDPQADLELAERRKILWHAIETLAENQKIAFTLSKFEGLSYREIAEIMGTTVSAVESLLNRAKSNLQKKLYGYYKEAF